MQNKKNLFGIGSLIILISAIVGIISCNKKFDTPPSAADQPIPAGYTKISVKDLKARHTTTAAYDSIGDKVALEVVVSANDRSGNLYKQMYVQDETGGIQIQLDQAGLYGPYPVGRKLWIKCDGLHLSDDAGVIVLGVKFFVNGTPSIAGIESQRIKDYIIAGSLDNPVEVKTVSVNDLGTNMQNEYIGRLIKLQGYQFSKADMDKTYSDTSNYKKTVNLYIQPGCTGTQQIVRTSAYASFAALNVPDGNGDITAIYTVFGSTKQFVIRDTTDVQFTGERCGANAPIISLSALRALYNGSDVDIVSNKIKGIVISDPKNISNGNIVLQDGNSGIDLFFGTAAATQLANFHVGDSLVVDISGGTLEKYNGMLEVVLSSSAVPLSAAGTAATGSGLSVVPVTRTIDEIGTKMDEIENTLVTIVNATATSGTYSGNKTLTDASGAMTLRTLTTAPFANDNLPATCQNWVGYVSRFNTTNQIYIRTLADVTAGSNCNVTPPPGGGIALGTTSPFLIDFNSIGAGLPDGVSVRTGASASALGTDITFKTSSELWKQTAGAFKNFASGTGLTATSDSASQANSTNRALGVRQVSNTSSTFPNGDPGVAFVFQIDNTVGKSNVQLDFLLQSLDDASTRTTTWAVDYAVGDAPTTFTPATTTGTMTTGGSQFSISAITASFGGALDNQTGKVWIRIVALTGTTGSGTRATTAIDNFNITWN